MPDEVLNEGALAAVNAALNGEDPPEVETPDPVDAGDGTVDAEAEAAADGHVPEGEAAEEAPESEGTEEEKAAAAGRERNPDGTFKKPEAKAESKPEEKPGEKKPEPAKTDPLNDPIPKDLKPQTQERVRTLIKMAKEATAETEQVRTDLNVIVNGLSQAGVTPQQYVETVSFLALFNSGDPAQQTKALELAESVADRLAQLLGKDRQVSDPIAAHQDLQAAVQRGQITPQYAKELARQRNSMQFRGQLEDAGRQQTQQQQQEQQALAQARNDLTTLEAALVKTDPDWERKKEILVPALQPVFQAIHPSQWRAKFEEAYRNMRLPAAAPRAAPRTPAVQPLRAGKQPAGGQSREPGSMLEALNAALGSMPGR